MWKKRLLSWNNQHHQLLCFVMEGKNGHRRFWLKGDEIQQFRFMLQSLLTSAITCLQPMDNPTSTNLFNVIYKILEISQCEVLFSHGIYKWPYIFKTKDRHLNLQDQNGKDKKYQKVKAQRPKSWSKTLQAVKSRHKDLNPDPKHFKQCNKNRHYLQWPTQPNPGLPHP